MKKLIFLFIVSFSLSLFSQQLQRIEPPFWWAGMQHSELQLLCYGDSIANYTVELSRGVITKIRKTENPNYLFVYIDTEGISP